VLTSVPVSGSSMRQSSKRVPGAKSSSSAFEMTAKPPRPRSRTLTSIPVRAGSGRRHNRALERLGNWREQAEIFAPLQPEQRIGRRHGKRRGAFELHQLRCVRRELDFDLSCEATKSSFAAAVTRALSESRGVQSKYIVRWSPLTPTTEVRMKSPSSP